MGGTLAQDSYMSNTYTKKMYEEHHAHRRGAGFSIFKQERGELFAHYIGESKEVLDLGCRDGALTSYYAAGNRVLGVDIDSVALSRAKENLGIETHLLDIQGDWAELQGRKFDAVVAGEVLEHLFSPADILKKISMHLLPGGLLVGSVPNAFSLKNRLRYLWGRKKHTPLSDLTHVNHFSARELQDLLTERFSTVQIIGLGRYRRLARMAPGLFAYDLAFVARL